MPEVAQRAMKVGGSLMLVIPKDVADETGIVEGDIVYYTPQKKRTSLFGKYPGLGTWEKQDPSVFSKYA